jgi:DNA-binding NarL/FixJ family response regulator
MESASREPEAGAAGQAPSSEASSAVRRVLFVDDEPSLLAALRRMLFRQRSRWDMTFAPGGAAALQAMQSEPYHVVITDMQMPLMDGAALLREVHEQYPQTALLVLSGYADAGTTTSASSLARQILTKPCDPQTLINAIDTALASLV